MARTRLIPLLLLTALVGVAAAGAKGGERGLTVRPLGARGPLVRYDLAHRSRRLALPAGMLSADGSRFAFVSARKLTLYGMESRRALRDASVPPGSSVEAVSATGHFVVVRTGPEVRVIDASRGRAARTLPLSKDFTVDAISPNGAWLYLIQHKGGQEYAVRRYDVNTRRLQKRELVQKGETEQMAGTAAGAVQSPDGNWQFTLYVNGEKRMAFVHALNLVNSYTICIDLPGQGSPAQLHDYSLALSPDLGHVYAANPALGLVADIAVSQSLKPLVKHFAAGAAAPTASAAVSTNGRMLAFSAGPQIWLYDVFGGPVRGPYAAAADVIGLGFANARRLFAARMNGPLMAYDAATGKHD